MNPSDIGTKALGRERFHRLRSMLGMGTELSETSSLGKMVQWRRVVVEISRYEYDGMDESNDRHV